MIYPERLQRKYEEEIFKEGDIDKLIAYNFTLKEVL